MLRIDTYAGKELVKLGISEKSFSSKNINKNEFEALSSKDATDIILIMVEQLEYISDKAFDELLELYRKNQSKFYGLLDAVDACYDDPDIIFKVLNDIDKLDSYDNDSDDHFDDPTYLENPIANCMNNYNDGYFYGESILMKMIDIMVIFNK